MSIETRDVFFKRETNYTYANVSLLRKLTVKKTKGCKKFNLYINGIVVGPTDQNSEEMIWHIPEVRARIRDTYDDNDYIRLHDTLEYNSLQAFSHYTLTPFEEFQNTIFTQKLQIQIRPDSRAHMIDCFEGREEVFESDVKRKPEMADNAFPN
jgi:hypothetical protein